MADTITAIEDDTRCLTTSVKREHRLLLEENLRRAKLLKEDISCLDTVAIWIEWWLR